MAQPAPNNTLLAPPPSDVKKGIAAEDVLPERVHGDLGKDSTPAKKAEGADVAEEEREPSYLMQGLLCAVASLEGADTQLLGASMKALQDDIGLVLMDISYMTVSQMVLTNLAAPFWGILADRGIMKRRTILLVGALGQGVVTIMLAFVTDMLPMVFLRALNGALLAALRPISNGIVADVTGESKRGKIFGRIQSALLLGMFITTMTVVPIATETVMGFQGWRVAFIIVGLISVIVSAAVTVFMQEPPRAEASCDGAPGRQGGCAAAAAEIRSLLRFFSMPTFCVMILQGIFGTIPWSVMGYMTLFFQLSGMRNGFVAVLTGIGPIAGAAGNVLGGLVADGLAGRLDLHGRPLSAQITVAFGIPLIYLIFMGVPVGEGAFGVYLALNIAFGLLGSWAQSGTNFPILSHIVPSEARSRIMAWECALENSIANAVGPFVVSLLAERVFGYTFGSHATTDEDIPSAEALGKAMAATICIPWMVCFCAYSMLHWSYPRDVRRLERAALPKAGAASSEAGDPAKAPGQEQKSLEPQDVCSAAEPGDSSAVPGGPARESGEAALAADVKQHSSRSI